MLGLKCNLEYLGMGNISVGESGPAEMSFQCCSEVVEDPHDCPAGNVTTGINFSECTRPWLDTAICHTSKARETENMLTVRVDDSISYDVEHGVLSCFGNLGKTTWGGVIG
jgi:hypothetical protein